MTTSRLAAFAILAVGATALAGDPPAKDAKPADAKTKTDAAGDSAKTDSAKTDSTKTTPPAGIQWFATWTAAAAEAKRTGRPIFLLAAAPQCHGISGVW